MSKESWAKGLLDGSFKNIGTMKKKKTGKPFPRPRGLHPGIHKERMKKRNELVNIIFCT